MSLGSVLSIASGGLANINAQFALISQNVANAATPGYSVEVANQQALVADGVGLGVHTGAPTRQIDQALQISVRQQNAVVSNAQTTQTALQAIDSVSGAPGSGSDIGSLLGNLSDSFSTLLTDPSSQAQQSTVVSSAATLANGINGLSAAYTAQRQAAQNDLGSAVTTLNSTLAAIGQLSNQIMGGQIGADITLRDTTLPTGQAALDEFAYGVSSRFAAQGLDLFTDPSGNVPSGGGTPAQDGYIGFAATIEVNPAVTADPSLVRDGTSAIIDPSSGAALFTPNPEAGVNGATSSGPAGFTALISNIVNYTFGTDVRDGVGQPSLNTNGLGPSGTLIAPFGAGSTLADFATNLTSSQAEQSATTTSNLTTEQALQTSLEAKVAAVSGVNMDTEMSLMLGLQNAYGANAKVIGAMQTMFTQILQSVQ